MRYRIATLVCLCLLLGGTCGLVFAAADAPPSKLPAKIIIDTDIGTDIDDAFAVALALSSPELDVRGVTTVTGDTEARARILDRMLGEVGREDIPVAVGPPTTPDPGIDQKRYGDTGPFARAKHPDAIEFVLNQIRQFPGEITLVAIGPLTNIGAIIDKSPETFRRLKRVVMMGGWFEPLSPDYGDEAATPATPEYNVLTDIPASQRLLSSGVPLYVMPLDATHHLRLDEFQRRVLFAHGSPLTDALTLLYQQWVAAGGVIPVLNDSLPIAFLIKPSLCSTTSMHVRVDEAGMTRVESGPGNAHVCLHSDADAFFRLHLDRLLKP